MFGRIQNTPLVLKASQNKSKQVLKVKVDVSLFSVYANVLIMYMVFNKLLNFWKHT